MKTKNAVTLIISVCWLLIEFFTLAVILHRLNFPAIDDLGNLVMLIVIFLLPLFGIVFSIVSKKGISMVSLILLVNTFVISCIFSFFSMTCFEMYYPISISKTENPKNYLILDELYSPIDYSELKITQVFPKSIPDCATEVDYEYRCEPSRMCWMIKAAWCLPNEEYFAEKQRIKGSTQSPVEFDELE